MLAPKWRMLVRRWQNIMLTGFFISSYIFIHQILIFMPFCHIFMSSWPIFLCQGIFIYITFLYSCHFVIYLCQNNFFYLGFIFYMSSNFFINHIFINQINHCFIHEVVNFVMSGWCTFLYIKRKGRSAFDQQMSLWIRSLGTSTTETTWRRRRRVFTEFFWFFVPNVGEFFANVLSVFHQCTTLDK